MKERRPTFEVIYRDKKVIIEEIHLPAGMYFFVSFENELPLFLSRDENSRSWASTPPGYQEVADEVGALIEVYLAEENK
ncbi:MAG TPA: hypothetical protein VGQ53_17405 [Chitinophagaceae bacterium]|jgi:hypothetical protein|nr:hypothetical protein [Chitinophagaceae bacterium]